MIPSGSALIASSANMLDRWDKRFLGLATHIGGWSKDPSTQVGAVITRGNKIVSVGYNGFARGVDDDPGRLHDREMKYKLMVHAEPNAILTAKQDLTGCTIYTVPFMPCHACASLIVQAGITKVVTYFDTNPRWAESFKLTSSIFEEADVKLIVADKEAN